MAKGQAQHANGKRKRAQEDDNVEGETQVVAAMPAKKAAKSRDAAAELSAADKARLIASMGDDMDGENDGAGSDSSEGGDYVEGDDDESQEEAEGEGEGSMEVDGAGEAHLEVKDDLYRPPTSDEMIALKETADLFKSNLFRMQTTELLSEVSLGAKTRESIASHLNALKEIVEGMKDLKEVEVTPTAVKGVNVPLSGTAAVKAAFRKPASMVVVGSYAAGFAAKPNVNVDVAVEMPQEYFQAKDHMNYRYFHKRAYYLAVVAAAIKRDGRLGRRLQYADWAGDTRRPILVIEPEAAEGSKRSVVFRVFPTISPSTFALNKLAPNRNSVRRHKVGAADAPDDVANQPATPRYNNAVLCDAYFAEHAQLLKECASAIPAFADSSILLRVWLRRRLLHATTDGVCGFVASMALAHLVGQRRINRHMSSYQIVRIALEFFANTDFVGTGVAMVKNTTDDTPALDLFTAAFDATFVDSSGRLNLMANMSKSAAEELRMHARASVAVLADPKSDAFDSLFMQQVDFSERYDNFVHIPSLPSMDAVGTARFADAILDWCDWPRLCSAFLVALLRKGLSDRALSVRPRAIPSSSNANKYATGTVQHLRDATGAQAEGESDGLTLGLLLHPENALRLVDLGPSPEDKDAATEFRAFWGAKAELRRFKDGRIVESAVWHCDRHERARIPERICVHLLARHARLAASAVRVVSAHALVSQALVRDGAAADTGPQDSHAAAAAFESLAKAIRSADLPLSITSVVATSPFVRGTDPFPPSALPLDDAAHVHAAERHNRWLDPALYAPLDGAVRAVRVWVSLESSVRWPDALEAVRRVRTAFQLRLMALLQGAKGGEFGPCAATDDHIEVAHKGFVFKISIAHEGEVTLLRARDPYVGARLHRNAFLRPSLASKLSAFAQRTAAFGDTCRLAKRWLRAHLLSGHFTDEAVELVVARCFAQPEPHVTPSTALSGFVRFLSLLASFDFASNPLIVDVEGEMKDASAIESKFRETERSRLPALFIATPESPAESTWTALGPTQPVLSRAVVLARESLRVVRAKLADSSVDDVDFSHIFRTPLDDYDVVFRLHANRIPQYAENMEAHSLDAASDGKKSKKGYKNLEANGARSLPLIDFNPVDKFVLELRKSFAHAAMFFHDSHGGDVVCVVFLPHTRVPRKFKVSHVQNTMPASAAEGTVVDNVDEMVAAMQRLGEGLVASVERRH